jgi:hypothetical protein
MTPQDKVAGWKGHKVILMPASLPEGDTGVLNRGTVIYKKVHRGEALPTALYAGKTATVIDVALDNSFPQYSDLTIRMDDTGEEIYVELQQNLGFLAEMELAQTLVGKTLWSKGRIWLDQSDRSASIEISTPGSPLVITRAEWGPFGNIHLRLVTKTGQEGFVVFDRYRHCLDARFHVECDAGWPRLRRFYAENPRELYRAWSTETWRLIETRGIRPGMTLEMVEAVCGADLHLVGEKLFDDKGNVAEIYNCDDKQVSLVNRKVAQWVKR